MARLSIIMGIYNCNNIHELKECIKSIKMQTYEDWEFIICNDGSTDNTLDLLNLLSKDDSRIKIVSYENNQGLAYALNYASEYTTGSYIARQDADDVSYPERFEKQIKFLDENQEYGFVGTIADVYDEKGIWGTYSLPEKPQIKDFLWNSPFLHPSVIMRKEIFYKVGGYRVAWETKRAEDYDLFMAIYSLGIIGFNIQEKLYKYKIVNNNNKYRPMNIRIQESVVRFKGYIKLGILCRGIPYVLKPILIGLIPQKIFKIIRKKQY